ncbi:MAG: hypothetical protein FWF82_01425 [Oscillospiraceae bacterium]|nr:hypothetical protein [Oscillospiraceae bacterium]
MTRCTAGKREAFNPMPDATVRITQRLLGVAILIYDIIIVEADQVTVVPPI